MLRVIVVILLFGAPSLSAEHVLRHSVTFSGKIGGTQTTTIDANGRIVVDFTYRNNGRGPDVREETVLDADGTQLSYTARGKSTFGAPIEERFERSGQRSSWRTLAGAGEIVQEQAAVYVPESILSEYSPETLAIVTRAVLRARSSSLPALPGGELRVEKLKETTLNSEKEPLAVALYGLHGLTTGPTFIWLTSDATMRFFASIDPGDMQIIETGSEPHANTLENLQLEAENELLAAIAKRLTHRLPDPIVFRNVHVFDSATGKRSEPSDVYISSGRIAAIYPAGSQAQGVGATVDGSGQTLMPGLFDMHSHEGPWKCLLQIAGGVTSSRDMGNDNPYLSKLLARLKAGEIIGPRIVPTGFIEGASPFSARSGIVVSDLQAAKDAVDWYAQRGYRQIKIYNSFHPEWVAPTAAHAHARGMRVSGHIPAFMKAEEAIAAGYDEIQHINQVLLNFIVGPKDDTRTLARFTLVADNMHRVDLDSEKVRRFFTLLKDRGTVIDTTVAIFEPSFTQMQGEPNPSYRDIEAHVPVALRRQWRTNSMDLNANNAETWRASFDTMLKFIGGLHQEGVPLVAGTDDIAGFTLHRELELYEKAGIPAPEALRIATRSGAKYTNTLDSLGSVEPGKFADLILVDGDPTANISDIRRVSLVMKAGNVYYPAELYEAVGITRFVDPPPITLAD